MSFRNREYHHQAGVAGSSEESWMWTLSLHAHMHAQPGIRLPCSNTSLCRDHCMCNKSRYEQICSGILVVYEQDPGLPELRSQDVFYSRDSNKIESSKNRRLSSKLLNFWPYRKCDHDKIWDNALLITSSMKQILSISFTFTTHCMPACHEQGGVVYHQKASFLAVYTTPPSWAHKRRFPDELLS